MMSLWDVKRFEDKASDLVKNFPNKLEEEITKVAKDENFNKEQIRRLSRMVNVILFNTKHAEMAKESHRMVDFDTIDAEKIINNLSLNENSKTASVLEARYPELNDEFTPSIPIKDSSLEKLAEYFNRSLVKELPLSDKLARYQNNLDNLEIEKHICDIKWKNAMEELNTKIAHIYFDFDDFEKNAVAFFGETVLPELNAIRREKGLPGIETTNEKLASISNKLVYEETEETNLLKQAIENRENYIKITNDIPILKQKIANTLSILRSASK